MKAIEISRYGGPEVLSECERSLPVCAHDEVLIKVRAAGVSRPDIFQRKGYYPPPHGASDIPGLEVAGEIVAGHLGQTGLRVGDGVCALVEGGGYAEFCAAPVAQCLPIPKGINYLEAASLPENFFTVWANVFEFAHLAPGESILIHGGSSGIGVTAIQIAKALGNVVYTTAGTEEKCLGCENLGADLAINYKQADFVDVILQKTKGQGVDVILDMVAGTYLEREIKCLADDGRVVIIALLGGARANLDLAQIMQRRLHITGSTLRNRLPAFKARLAGAVQERVWPLIEAGRVSPLIYKVFNLSEASAAHRLMESGVHFGKIILNVS